MADRQHNFHSDRWWCPRTGGPDVHSRSRQRWWRCARRGVTYAGTACRYLRWEPL